MAKLVIANASTTKSFEYQECGRYDNSTLAANSSVEVPLTAVEWYSGAEKRAWYEALDGAMDGAITVTYDADTDVNTMSFHVTAAATGADLEGATVTYGDGLTLTTDANGDASVSSLIPGTYNITVSKATYTSFTTSVTFADGQVGNFVAEVALILA